MSIAVPDMPGAWHASWRIRAVTAASMLSNLTHVISSAPLCRSVVYQNIDAAITEDIAAAD